MSNSETARFAWKAHYKQLEIRVKNAEKRLWDRRNEFATNIYYVVLSLALLIIIIHFVWR